MILGVFVYYFIGLIISRVGSLIIEPLLKKTKLLNYADYKDFVICSKCDSKLDLFLEINNMYRTLISMLLLLMLLIGYQSLSEFIPFIRNIQDILLLLCLLLLFIFSYKKQTNYITKRIKNINK